MLTAPLMFRLLRKQVSRIRRLPQYRLRHLGRWKRMNRKKMAFQHRRHSHSYNCSNNRTKWKRNIVNLCSPVKFVNLDLRVILHITRMNWNIKRCSNGTMRGCWTRRRWGPGPVSILFRPALGTFGSLELQWNGIIVGSWLVATFKDDMNPLTFFPSFLAFYDSFVTKQN